MTDNVKYRLILNPIHPLHIGNLSIIYQAYNKLSNLPDAKLLIIINDLSNIYLESDIEKFIKDLLWLNLKKIKIVRISKYYTNIIGCIIQLLWNNMAYIHNNNIYLKNTVNYNTHFNYYTGWLTNHLVPLHPNDPIILYNFNNFGAIMAKPIIDPTFGIAIIDFNEQATCLINTNYPDNSSLYENATNEIIFSYLNPHIYNLALQHYRIPPINSCTIDNYRIINLNYTHGCLLKLLTNNSIPSYNEVNLLTISGIRKKGYPPKILKKFAEYGNKLADVDIRELDTITINTLISDSKKYNIYKGSCIIDPIKVIINNWEENTTEFIVRNKFRNFIPICKVLYLERIDCASLKVGMTIRLKFSYFLKIVSILPEHITVNVLTTYYKHTIPKYEFLNWVSSEKCDALPRQCTVNISKNFYLGSGAVPPINKQQTYILSYDLDNFFTSLKAAANDNQAKTYKNSRYIAYQSNPIFNFDKLGFFTLDLDTFYKDGSLVFNMLIGLKKLNSIVKTKTFLQE
jgi:hypothetical protein